MLTSATSSGAGQVDVASSPDSVQVWSIRIEFFGTTCDASGYGEARRTSVAPP